MARLFASPFLCGPLGPDEALPAAAAPYINGTRPSGTPNDVDALIVRLTNSGTARAITGDASPNTDTVVFLTTTVISTLLVAGFVGSTATLRAVT
jgi:hypothetical protein